MLSRTLYRCTILLSAMMTASVGPFIAGCSAPQLSKPSQEAPTERQTNFQAWNPLIVSDPDGRIYLTFFGGPGGTKYNLFFNRSLDGGATWLPQPFPLDSPNPPNIRIGFHLLEPNGEGAVAVTWLIERFDGSYWRPMEVRHRRSADSGANWPDTLIRWEFHGGSNYPVPWTGTNGSLNLIWVQKPRTGLTGLNFNRTSQGSNAWMAAPTLVPGSGDASPNGKKADQPSPPPPELAWPTLASDGRGRLYVAWQDISPKGSYIYFNRSLDGGTTWLAPALRLNSPPPFFNTSRFPRLVLDRNGGVYAFWEDLRHGASDIYFNRSLDGGTTWLEEDLRLTPDKPPQADSISPAIVPDKSGRLYVAWLDSRVGSNSVYFNRSLDQGRTWLPHAIRLDHHGNDAFSYAIDLRSDDAGHIYVAWWERPKDGKDTIHFNRSGDYGSTWLDKDTRLDSDGAGKGKEGSRFPRIAADKKGGVYIVWSNDQNGKLDLFLNRSTDHGVTWLPKEIQVTR